MNLKIHKIGLRETDDALIKLRVILTNLIALFTFPLLVFYLPLFYREKFFQPFFAFAIVSIALLITLWCNKKRQFKAASYLIIIASNVIIFYTIVAFGMTGQSQSLIPIVMIFVFIFFDRLPEYLFFCTLTLMTFLVSFLYLDFGNPTFAPRVLEYDYYINLGFGIFSCGVLAFIVTGSLRSHIAQQSQHIKELETKSNIIRKHNEEMELFTTMASHDLKTPVRTINSFLGLIEKSGEIKNKEVKEYLSLAQSGSRQLDVLINGISRFRELDKNPITNNYKTTKAVIEEVILGLSNFQKETFQIQFKDLPDLKIFHVHLYQIFQNLFENAIKYNLNNKKEILIQHQIADDHVLITVTDNGIGIDKAYLEYIFEPFKKLNASNKYQSTGLGLAICKKILELYEGTITASSSEKGSQFIIKLPKSLLV